MPKTTDPAPSFPLNREKVLKAAIALADQHGLDALSMRKLAQSLGVEAMSLYNHIANKDDLFDGMVDIVISEIAVPNLGNDDWKQAMRDRANSAHSVLLQHPWATITILSRINVGPAMLRYIDATLGCLHQAGFSYPMADHAWNAMDNHIYGFTLQELNFPFEVNEYQTAAENYLSLIPADEYPDLNQLTHHILDERYDGVHDFEFGLNLILDGLERWRDPNA